MRLLTLFLTRGDVIRNDDVLHFDDVVDLPDFVRITATYAPVGTSSGKGHSRSFVLSRAGAVDYVNSLVRSLIMDTDPFLNVQLCSAIFPSVIYAVEDLENNNVCASIQEIVWSSFNTTVE
jgi:hypothetical protein